MCDFLGNHRGIFLRQSGLNFSENDTDLIMRIDTESLQVTTLLASDYAKSKGRYFAK